MAVLNPNLVELGSIMRARNEAYMSWQLDIQKRVQACRDPLSEMCDGQRRLNWQEWYNYFRNAGITHLAAWNIDTELRLKEPLLSMVDAQTIASFQLNYRRVFAIKDLAALAQPTVAFEPGAVYYINHAGFVMITEDYHYVRARDHSPIETLFLPIVHGFKVLGPEWSEGGKAVVGEVESER